MRFFFSAGEPSGDLHGSNLIRAIRARAPDCDFVGFGGEQMSSAGCRLLAPLSNLSLMWFKAYQHYFKLKRLVRQAEILFCRGSIDALVLIDFPGFNWHLAKRAHKCGVPVFYFVPPQLWAWGGWRARKMRRWVDHVLCTLPFEQQWFATRGINAHYVGHPYFDALHERVLNRQFIDEQRRKPGRIIALLPGSRRNEIHHNLSTILRSAHLLYRDHSDVRFVAAALNDEFRDAILANPLAQNLPLEICADRTSEILSVAEASIAVSGSVGLELLYYELPSVVAYRVLKLGWLLTWLLKKVPWMSLVNLLAGKLVFPEFLSSRCFAKGVAAQISEWLSKPEKAAQVRCELRQLRDRFAVPGACGRAADYILGHLSNKATRVFHSRVNISGVEQEPVASRSVSSESRSSAAN